jgi:hypothetical protein
MAFKLIKDFNQSWYYLISLNLLIAAIIIRQVPQSSANLYKHLSFLTHIATKGHSSLNAFAQHHDVPLLNGFLLHFLIALSETLDGTDCVVN